MTNKLTTLATELKAQHPAHTKTIAAGLALALLGRVKPNTDGYGITESYTVNGYTITSLSLRGWACTCPQGASFGPAIDGFFIDQLCRHFCKHIAAAAMTWQTDEFPSQPANVLEAFRLMVEAGEIPAVKEQLPLTKTVNMVRLDRDGRDTLLLKSGYIVSKPLAHWGTDRTGQENEGRWIFEPDIEARYQDWVTEVKK